MSKTTWIASEMLYTGLILQMPWLLKQLRSVVEQLYLENSSELQLSSTDCLRTTEYEGSGRALTAVWPVHGSTALQ
jgi:hypothetical protein